MLLLRRVLGVYVALTMLTGLAYPLLLTGVAALAAPRLATGSLVERDGRAVGSALLGQPFQAAGHFWSRPSATTPQPYNGAASGASNLGPTNPALRQLVADRIAALRAADPTARRIPVDLVTASASGLDPHISPAAAYYQVHRVAVARSLNEGRLRALVEAHIEPRTLGVLGEPRVNVLGLNLALDAER